MTKDSDSFSHTTLPSLGKRVLRIGLAGNYGIDPAGVRHAAERGIDYWLWTPRFKKVTPVLRDILARDREAHVVSYLAGALLKGGIRRNIEKALKALGTEYLDCFKLAWLGRTARYNNSIRDALLQLKEEGKIRSFGCSIHDRKRAGQLARESAMDTFMLRYNAKHPGAEVDIFPHLAERNPTIIAYTATAWRQLLKPYGEAGLPPWPGSASIGQVPPLTAPLCYRFCLSNPHVHVVLTGPKDRTQLDQNLDALEAGPLTVEELDWVRQYGAFVKKNHKRDYI